jgi:hypothetical protein
MATTLHDLEPKRSAAEDEHSVREALRITMLFLLVVLLLVWAGVADAAPLAADPDFLAAACAPGIYR